MVFLVGFKKENLMMYFAHLNHGEKKGISLLSPALLHKSSGVNLASRLLKTHTHTHTHKKNNKHKTTGTISTW